MKSNQRFFVSGQRPQTHQWVASVCFYPAEREWCTKRKSERESWISDGVIIECKNVVIEKKRAKSRKWIGLFIQSVEEEVRRSSCLGLSQEIWPSTITQWRALCEPVCGLKALRSSQARVCAWRRSLTSLTPIRWMSLMETNNAHKLLKILIRDWNLLNTGQSRQIKKNSFWKVLDKNY